MFDSPQARSCLKKILIPLIALGLAACDTQVQPLGGENGTTSQSNDTVVAELDVVAQKGPFLDGSAVTLYELNSAGALVRSKDVSKQFENLGRFRVNVPWSGPTVIEISGPFYDEVQGFPSQEQSTLRSLLDVEKGGKGIGNINVLTDLFSTRVLYFLQRGEAFETAMNTARLELMNTFGLELAGGAMASDLDLMSGDGALAPDNANLLLFSGTVMATGSPSIMNNLRDEFATTGDLVCGLEALRSVADSVSIDELAANLKQLDPAADPPDSVDLAAADPVWLQAGSTTCGGSGTGGGGGTVDHKPVAQDDAVSVNEDASANADLAVNDSGLEDGGIVYALASAPTHGTADVNADGSFSYTPLPDYNGTDAFDYAVTDKDGDLATATAMITVVSVDDLPVANDDAVSTSQGSSVEGDVSSNDSGFGDGGIVYSLAGAPANGSVSVDTNGRFTYTPNGSFGGVDSFDYQVRDSDGDTANAMVSVTVTAVNTNATPVAVNDSVSVAEDASVSGDLRANDSGLEDGVVYSLSNPPANGNAVVDTSGGFQYTPNADFNGSDSFGYLVSDADGESDSATVSITVNAVNDTPVAAADSASVNEDSQVSGDLSANDSGLVDGGIAYRLQSAPSNGSAQVQSNGRYTYTPASDFNGSDSFSYAVSDADGDEATATVSVTVNPVNDLPVAANDTATIRQGERADIAVLANDTGLGDGVASISVTQPANGSVTVDSNDVVSYTPDTTFYGSESFSYTITDGNGDRSVASVGVDVECAACGQAVLSWDPPSTYTDGSPLNDDLTAFNVYFGTAPGDRSNQIRIDDPAATTYTVDGLSGGWTYYFVVTAVVDGVAESAPSNEVSKAIIASGP
jgi:VCBS repeat-containing protein